MYSTNHETTREKFDIIVIGGGVPGMMAAGTAANRGKRVLLIEKINDLVKSCVLPVVIAVILLTTNWMCGNSLKITVLVDAVKKFSKKGNILCTHFEFSGPLILNTSKQIADAFHEGGVSGIIDLFPKKDIGNLNKELVSFLNLNKNKQFKN